MVWWCSTRTLTVTIQYIPRNMYTVFALLCFVVVIHWLIFTYPSGLLHWHSVNLTIAPVPAKQPWWIWINTSCEFIMNDYITTTKQSTTKPCAYFLGYTVLASHYNCKSYQPRSCRLALIVNNKWKLSTTSDVIFQKLPEMWLQQRYPTYCISFHIACACESKTMFASESEKFRLTPSFKRFPTCNFTR